MKAEYTFVIEGRMYMEQMTTALLASGYILASKKRATDTYEIKIYGKEGATPSISTDDIFTKSVPTPAIKKGWWDDTYTVTSVDAIGGGSITSQAFRHPSPRDYEKGKSDE